MARIPKAQGGRKVSGQGWKCGPSGCSGAATGKFKSNKSASGYGRLTRSQRREQKYEEAQDRLYGPDPSVRVPAPQYRQYPVNYRKDRKVSEGVARGLSTARRGVKIKKAKNGTSTPAWQRKEGKDPSGGLNAKGVASYRAANPGSKLKTAVTTKPSKLKAGSKAANRRKSFCARMSGMKKRLTSAKTANDPNSRINKSLRKWNC